MSPLRNSRPKWQRFPTRGSKQQKSTQHSIPVSQASVHSIHNVTTPSFFVLFSFARNHVLVIFFFGLVCVFFFPHLNFVFARVLQRRHQPFDVSHHKAHNTLYTYTRR